LKGEVEQLKKEVAELKTQNEEQEKTIEEINKQEPEAKSTPVKPLTPNNQQTTPTTVKLSNLNSFIDSAIVVYQNNITFSYKVVDQIDDFINHLKKGRALAQAYLDVDTEPYFINGWKLIISEGVEKPLKYEEDVRATFLNNINLMKQNVADLENEKNKNLLSAPVSVEQYWTYYDQLKEKIKVEEFSKTISDNYDKFYTYASQKEKELNTAMMVFADKELAYYKSNVDFWNGINASRQTSNYAQINNYSQPTYQPPILQMPKITHCTISGDGGVGIQAYIDCTTSSF
jgi:predicted  nucleic acid-binding Zn-ribbon protein